MNHLVIDNLSLKTKKKVILENISYVFRSSSIIGINGDNGSGKTCFLKICAGLIIPTSGRVQFNDEIPYKLSKKFIKSIGVHLSGSTPLIWEDKVEKGMLKIRYFYGIRLKEIRKRMDEINEVLPFYGYLKENYCNLSLGQQNICNLVTTYLHNPELILLDEPNIGIDKNNIIKMASLIEEYNKKNNATTLVSFHQSQPLSKILTKTIGL